MKKILKVLISEEEDNFTKNDQRLMSDYGMKLYFSKRDGGDLISKVHVIKPDVVIFDVFMPKVDGIGVLRSINEDTTSKTPIMIVMSNSFTPSLEK